MLLYLLKPGGLDYNGDLPGAAEDLLGQGLDLNRLTWQPSEKVADEVTLAMAVRYGYKVRDGLVLDGARLVHYRQVQDVTATGEASRRSQARIEPQKALLDSMGFSSAEQRRRTDEGVEASRQRVIAEAWRQHEALLSARDPQADLIAHWVGLGGRQP